MTMHLLCVGGADHHLRIPFLMAVAQYGFRITAAGTGDPGPFTKSGLDYRRFQFDRFVNPLADIAALRQLAHLIADVGPDLVQCFDTKPNLLVPLVAARAGHVPVVRTVNGLGWLYSSRSLAASALRPVYRVLHRIAARSTAVTVFQNREDRAEFERHRMIGAGQARLVAGSGIDIAGFEQAVAAAPSAASLRATLGIGDCPVVMTVTRITRQKGVPTLLKAAALVHAARPDVRFLLVGPRDDEGRAAVKQAELDRHARYVLALGPRKDVPALLRMADVFAFPTEYREGVPRALLEAGLAGLPIVSTDMPGCNDVIRHGWNGLLVPPRSPRALAERILDLLTDSRSARLFGSRAAEVVRQEFGLPLTVARYASIYLGLARGPHPQLLGTREPRGRAGQTAANTN